VRIRVFIQNEAGSARKHYHNEKTLELVRVADVSEPYPYPYGFILDTTAEDGWNVDCYVITDRPLRAAPSSSASRSASWSRSRTGARITT
jgi:inorganic pyrophosphatase